MLKYDGTEDYKLDPNDYTKKLDGTDSDATNTDYEGNVMIAVPKVYWRIAPVSDDVVYIYISNNKINDKYVCWAHINNYGDEIPYMYLSAYILGVPSGSAHRSISGIEPKTLTPSNGMYYVSLNNKNNDNIWSLGCYNDWLLIVLLTLLISRTPNARTIFGAGYVCGTTSTSSIINSGTLDKKGLFWGTNDGEYGVKIFGIEHFWGYGYRIVLGAIYANGLMKIKLTYGTQDGSTVEGYNVTGDGYISIANSTVEGAVGANNANYHNGYITKMMFNEYGMFVKTLDSTNGANLTYYATRGYYLDEVVYMMAAGSLRYYGLDVTNVLAFCTYGDDTWPFYEISKCLPKLAS
jgi:hypothetical protein